MKERERAGQGRETVGGAKMTMKQPFNMRMYRTYMLSGRHLGPAHKGRLLLCAPGFDPLGVYEDYHPELLHFFNPFSVKVVYYFQVWVWWVPPCQASVDCMQHFSSPMSSASICCGCARLHARFYGPHVGSLYPLWICFLARKFLWSPIITEFNYSVQQLDISGTGT